MKYYRCPIWKELYRVINIDDIYNCRIELYVPSENKWHEAGVGIADWWNEITEEEMFLEIL